jgi:hypothetical protein
VQIRGDAAMFMAFKEVLAEFLGSKEPKANDATSDGKSKLQISPGGCSVCENYHNNPQPNTNKWRGYIWISLKNKFDSISS